MGSTGVTTSMYVNLKFTSRKERALLVKAITTTFTVYLTWNSQVENRVNSISARIL